MADHVSAKKRARQNIVRRARNQQYLSSVRTAVKNLKTAAAEGKAADEVQKLFVTAQSALAKAAAKGLLHSGNASRRIGRLAAVVKNLGTAPKATTPAKKSSSKAKAKAAPKKEAVPKKEKAAPKAKKAAAKTTKKK